MDRIINVKVGGNHLSKDSKNAGVRGEADVTNLRITFDEGWDGYAKTVTFFDAYGKNPVKRIETVDLLEDITKDTRTYITPIPKEAMAIAGELTFVIDGFYGEFVKNDAGEYEVVSGGTSKRQRSISDKLVVKDSPMADDAGEPTDPTPTAPEQWQMQVDNLVGEIQGAVIAKDEARELAESAMEYAKNTQENTIIASQKASEAEESAIKSEIASNSAGEAKDDAETAKESAEKSADLARQSAADAQKAAEAATDAVAKMDEILDFVITLDNDYNGDKTYEEVQGAYSSGRRVYGVLESRIFHLHRVENNTFCFAYFNEEETKYELAILTKMGWVGGEQSTNLYSADEINSVLKNKADVSLFDGSYGVYICPEDYNAQIVTEYTAGRNGTIFINGFGNFETLDGDVICNKDHTEHRLSEKVDTVYINEQMVRIQAALDKRMEKVDNVSISKDQFLIANPNVNGQYTIVNPYRVEVRKGDVRAVTDDGADHWLSLKADQTFVEEKLAEIGGGGISTEQWRLINDVTLTEDAVVEFTTDADGNPFELKKMRILVRIPKLETQSQLWLKTGDYIAVYSDNIPTSANTPAVSIDGELKNAWIFTTCYVATGAANSGTVKSFPSGSRLANSENVLVNPVKKITLAFNSGFSTPLPVGTKIQFWGVDA